MYVGVNESGGMNVCVSGGRNEWDECVCDGGCPGTRCGGRGVGAGAGPGWVAVLWIWSSWVLAGPSLWVWGGRFRAPVPGAPCRPVLGGRRSAGLVVAGLGPLEPVPSDRGGSGWGLPLPPSGRMQICLSVGGGWDAGPRVAAGGLGLGPCGPPPALVETRSHLHVCMSSLTVKHLHVDAAIALFGRCVVAISNSRKTT